MGTARDAGEVQPGTPSFFTQGRVGWRSVTRAGTGEYCLTPDATSTKANTSLLLSTGGPAGGGEGTAVWGGYCGSSTFELKVDTYTLSGAASDQVYFEAAVPSSAATDVGATGSIVLARDAGSVYPIAPSFYPEGRVGWVSVTRIAAGEYCLTPDATTTYANTTLLLSTGSAGGGGAEGVAVWAGDCGGDPLELLVETYTLSGLASNSVPFEAVIPSVFLTATAPQASPGSVPDAGYVYSATPSFNTEGLSGWRAVTRAGTGEYCLTPDATASAAGTSLLLSTGGAGGKGEGVATWDGYCGSSTFELKVETYDFSGTPSGSISFEAVALLASATTGTAVLAATARDAGEVYPAAPSFDTQGLVGWRAVTRVGPGEYCLTPDATSTKANTSLLLSTGGPQGGGEGIAVWDGYCSSSAFELKVDTYLLTGVVSDQVYFAAAVPAGASGATGPEGMSSDAGSIYPISPSFYSEGRQGWASVARRGPGEYCLTPDAGSTVTDAGLLLSTGGAGGAGTPGIAIWAGYCSASPLELEVDTYTLSGTASNSVPFEAVVPSAPPGATGAPAPGGTVPDAGVVSVHDPSPAFSSVGLVGWRSVTRASTGQYCLASDPASTFANAALLLSALSPGVAVWAGYCSTNPLELEVDTYTLSGAAVDSVSFEAVLNQAPASAPAACTSCGANLIVNPGAESAPGADADSVVRVPGWRTKGSFTAAQYAWSDGDVSASSPGPKARGKNYFYGGPGGRLSSGAQAISVRASGIATGKVSFTLSGWLGGYADQGDNATLYLTWEDAAGHGLAVTRQTVAGFAKGLSVSAQIGPVTPERAR